MTTDPRETVLVVDDEARNVELMTRLLKSEGYDVQSTSDGATALDMIAANPPDLILLDVQMPGINGFEVCRRLKQAPATRLIPVVLVTGLSAREDRIEGINAGADDFLGKPFDNEELRARVRSLLRVQRYLDDLESAESVILSLAMTVEARDRYTFGHCERLARYSVALGEVLGLRDEDLSALRLGGYLHDVGKISVSDAILQKPGRLTETEYEAIKQHSVIGEKLCGTLRSLRHVRPIVRHHHERRDGHGYPDGLRNDEIPLLAQIVAVADVFDAVTTSRPYRPAMPAEVAYAELRSDVAKGLLREDLVEIFVALDSSGRLQGPSQEDRAAGSVLT